MNVVSSASRLSQGMPAKRFLVGLLAAFCVRSAPCRAAGDGLRRIHFGDTFNLAPAASPVAGFTAYGGTWEVKDGILHAGPGAGPKLIADRPPFSEGWVGAEVLLPDGGGGNAGFIVKVGEPGIGADKFNGYEISLDAENQYLRLGRHRQNFELIRDTPCEVPVNQWVALAVRMDSASLEVRINGKTIVAYKDDRHPLVSGTFGIRPWQRKARFRNLWVGKDDARQLIPFSDGASEKERTETLRTEELPRIALVTRHPLSHPNTISCDLWQARPHAPGCSIRIIDPAHPERPPVTVFEDTGGCIYDMNVSFNARTLFFSYQRKGERYWHIWQINVDGTGLRQLTDGDNYDVGPCLLPNGDIAFVSTRRFGYTVCQPGPASNLHVMSPDGSNIRCVSMNTLADFSPQVLPDGRLLFTRWEYIDRDLTYRQSLWTQNPDGTGYQLFFGNTIRDVGSFWQARPLPGSTDWVVATFAPHHHWPHGAIGLIDRKQGVEGPKGKGYLYLTREFPSIGDRGNEWSYRDPFPLSDRTFLCSYGGGDARRFRTYLLDIHGNKRPLYEDPEMGCYFPIPLRPVQPPPDYPSSLSAPSWQAPTSTVDNATGTLLLVDVYRGLGPTIARGRAKTLRVMEQVRKTEDLHSRAYDQSPLMSYGTYYAKRCWGTVPIMEDGSAHFEAPALREIYFQVLDAEGRELQRMTSAVQLMPGERVSCVGCHEPRDSSPPADAPAPMAARRPAMRLRKPDWGNDGIVEFTKLVQPVLDKYCVKCHGGTDPKGGYDFSGDITRYFSMAYDNLLGRSRSYRQHDMMTGEMLPQEKARGKPLVHFFWLLRTPSGVNQPLWTGSHASRLTEIIESDHCKRKIPLADRKRVYTWIDANVPYYGTYAHSRPRSPGKRDLFTDADRGTYSPWFARDFSGVFKRRCASCHGKIDGTTHWEGRYAWVNLTYPERSPALTAHLPKPAGGRGIDLTKDGKPITMFGGRDDPDYVTMLNAIRVGQSLALETPRADMPAFQGRKREP